MEGLLSQTLIIHLIRTRKIPFFQSMAARPVLWSTGMIMAVGIALPYSPLALALNMQALPPSYLIWLTGILLGYGVFTYTLKTWYIKKFNSWL
jgi:Mg2+-importing ATPase